MLIGFLYPPPYDKGGKALIKAMGKLVKSACPDTTFKPYPSGYTDEKFDAYLYVGEHGLTPTPSMDLSVTQNALRNHIPSLGFGIDVSPVLGSYTRLTPLLVSTISAMNGVMVRSSGSQKLLERQGIKSQKIPDLTWSLEPEPIEYDVPENTVAICAFQNIENLGKLIKSLVWELRTNDYNVIQIREGAVHVALEGTELTPREASWEQNITILKKCKALITTSYHAAICGYKAGIPVMTLPVQEKTYWLAEELGLPRPLPFAALQAPRYVCNELKKLITNPPEITIPRHETTVELLKGFFNEYVPAFGIK